MAIHTMSSESEADYSVVSYPGWDRAKMGPLYMSVSYAGCVLDNQGEYNGRDDSDFYATVWNDATGMPEKVTFASTRGWTYPNHAEVDATPEVWAKYAAWQEKLRLSLERRKEEERQERQKEAERQDAVKAESVELAKRRRQPARLGKVTGELAWVGVSSSGKSVRVGVRTVTLTPTLYCSNYRLNAIYR